MSFVCPQMRNLSFLTAGWLWKRSGWWMIMTFWNILQIIFFIWFSTISWKYAHNIFLLHEVMFLCLEICSQSLGKRLDTPSNILQGKDILSLMSLPFWGHDLKKSVAPISNEVMKGSCLRVEQNKYFSILFHDWMIQDWNGVWLNGTRLK